MSSRPAARSHARAVLVVAVTLLALLASAGPAFAHASLIGSNPAEGAVLQTAPSTVTLTFDDALAEFEPTVVITGPDGNQYQSGPATISGVELSSAVAPLTVPGAYTIAYRVVSADGHPVQGEVHFELAAPEPTTPPSTTQASTSSASPSAPSPPTSTSAGPAPTVTSGADTAAASSSAGWSGWPWVISLLVVAPAILALLIVRRRTATSARARDGAA